MTKIKRITEIIIGLIMVAYGLIMISFQDDAYRAAVSLLSLTFAFMGLKYLFYYFTMARFMVNGRMILYKGVILFDFGLVSASLIDMPKIYLLTYLVSIHALTGAVDILRAMEARRFGARSWKLKFSHGIGNLILAACCLIFIKKINIAVNIFAIGLIYSGIIRIITAFRKTSLIYIR